VNERDLNDFRRHARRRSGAAMALFVGPIVLVVTAVKILEPHDYPAGDIRNEPLFWIVMAVVALVVIGALLVGAIRVLVRPRAP
jgi:hypothetical protein